jgi:flagellin-like protein
MDNKGVSAVIGVIVMVAVTVAIAATVYVYVSDMLNPVEEPFQTEYHYVEGLLIDAWFHERSISLPNGEHWWITMQLNENTTPKMYFFRDNQIALTKWSIVEPMIGEDVIITYKHISETNSLMYFCCIGWAK